MGAARRDVGRLLKEGRYSQGIHSAEGKDLSPDQANPVGCGGCGERVGCQNSFSCCIEEEQVHSCQPAKDLPDLNRGDSTPLREGHDPWGCS